MKWDAEANAELAREHGLYTEEWERLLTALGRTPNLVELGIFSVLWSEHCSYKSSRAHLRIMGSQPSSGSSIHRDPQRSIQRPARDVGHEIPVGVDPPDLPGPARARPGGRRERSRDQRPERPAQARQGLAPGQRGRRRRPVSFSRSALFFDR